MTALKISVFVLVTLLLNLSAVADPTPAPTPVPAPNTAPTPEDVLKPILGEYDGIDSSSFFSSTPCKVNFEMESREDDDGPYTVLVVRSKLMKSENPDENVYHYGRVLWTAAKLTPTLSFRNGKQDPAYTETTEIKVTFGANSLPTEVDSAYSYTSADFSIPTTRISCKNLVRVSEPAPETP